MKDEFIYVLILRDHLSKEVIKNIPLTVDNLYDYLNKWGKSYTQSIILNVKPSQFIYYTFFLANMFDYIRTCTSDIFKIPFVSEQYELILKVRKKLLEASENVYCDYDDENCKDSYSIIDRAFNEAQNIDFDIKPMIVSQEVDKTLYGFIVLNKLDDLTSDEKNNDSEKPTENIYESEEASSSSDKIIDKVVNEALIKEKKDPKKFKIANIYYLHPKFLTNFEDMASNYANKLDFDFNLNLYTTFIFYSALLENKFELSDNDKKQIKRIINKFKTRIKSSTTADFDLADLTRMTAEQYDFVLIDMPSPNNNIEILSNVILSHFVTKQDEEFFISMSVLLYQNDIEDDFHALTASKYILNRITKDNELNKYAVCMQNLCKEKGTKTFVQEFKKTLDVIIEDPTYEFFFGTSRGREYYDEDDDDEE